VAENLISVKNLVTKFKIEDKIITAVDDVSFIECTASTDPACTNIDYSGGSLSFTAEHFTTFRGAEGAPFGTGPGYTECGILNQSNVL